MEELIKELVNDMGYWAILLLIAVENLFPPIPSEVILTFGGFMTNSTKLTPFGVIVVATLGSLLGAIILYYVGRIVSVERLEKIVERWGKVLRVKKEDLYRADAWFDKHGNKAVFFCRMVPLIRSLISIPAGMSGMKLAPFLIYTTLGTIIWNTLLVMLGTTLGDRWEDIVEFMDVYSNIAYGIIALIAIVVLVLYLRRFRKNKG